LCPCLLIGELFEGFTQVNCGVKRSAGRRLSIGAAVDIVVSLVLRACRTQRVEPGLM
jgi:hypothetical protein